jgi:hypothetical protein
VKRDIAPSAAASSRFIFANIERLSPEEFAAKKAELLSRL